MNALVEWLSHHLFTCPSKYFFGLDCPGCGLQRSIIALLEGDVGKSFQLYPATLPLLFCFIFTALHIKFDFKHGAAVITGSYILCAAVIVIFFIYKIFTHKLV